MSDNSRFERFYTRVLEESGKGARRMLEQFGESLGNWLYDMLNWPTDDWRRQLDLLVEHTRYYGLVIEPSSIQAIHDLVEARVNCTGPFAGFADGGAGAAAENVSIQLALEPGGDDGTRSDAVLDFGSNGQVELAMALPVGVAARKAREGKDDPERFFNRKLAQAQGHVDEMRRILEVVGRKLDSAKPLEEVDVDAEARAVEELIWRYHDAIESAREVWLRKGLSHKAFERLVGMETPLTLGLPWYLDQRQARRADMQTARIGEQLGRHNLRMERVVAGMQAVEWVGTVAGVIAGGGLLYSIGKKGGKWAVVKGVAVAGAAIAVEQTAEKGLRAAGASEETIRGVRLAAAVISYILLRLHMRAARAKAATPPGPSVPASPKAEVPTNPRSLRSDRPRGPLKNASGDLEEAARAARTQPHGATASKHSRSQRAVRPHASAMLGEASTINYRETFFKAYPELRGKVVVHHAIPRKAMLRYPEALTRDELHSLENLRGIPKASNPELHLSRIAKEWNEFYRAHELATKEQLLQKATEIDLKFGQHFTPPVGG